MSIVINIKSLYICDSITISMRPIIYLNKDTKKQSYHETYSL